MKDVISKEPLVVSDDPAGPYITLPEAQLSELLQLLDQHGIRYEVEELIFSFDGGPEEATVDLGRDGDAARVQAILDSVN